MEMTLGMDIMKNIEVLFFILMQMVITTFCAIKEDKTKEDVIWRYCFSMLVILVILYFCTR